MRGARRFTAGLGLVAVVSSTAYGGEAADLVGALTFGAAADIAAASPMGVASIAAKTDVEIAKIYQDLAEYQADSASAVAKYQANDQVAIARAQSLAALDIFRIQEAGKNYRLDRQLTELKDARKDAMKFQLENLRQQWAFQDRYLDILAMQGRFNEKIARLALQYQLTANGMANGRTNVGSPFTVTNDLKVGFGATAPPPAGLTVTARPRPSQLAVAATAATRYPGRPHAAAESVATRIKPLSTHAY